MKREKEGRENILNKYQSDHQLPTTIFLDIFSSPKVSNVKAMMSLDLFNILRLRLWVLEICVWKVHKDDKSIHIFT